MTCRINREDRKGFIYRPVGTGFTLAAALQQRGWKLRCEQWNDEEDLLRIDVPGDRADVELVADIEAAFPDEDFELSMDG
jgi:hypothetical protein